MTLAQCNKARGTHERRTRPQHTVHGDFRYRKDVIKRVAHLQPSSVPYLDISQTPPPPMASAEMNATRAHGRPRQRGLHSR